MKRASNYIATVPNTSDGWRMIELLQSEFGRGNLRLRGRYANRKEFFNRPEIEKSYTGRWFVPNWGYVYAPNKNDINHKEIYAVRENAIGLNIAIYHR